MNTENHSQTAAFIWSVADLLRGDFKQSQYGRIILPFILLRRLECVLEPTKAKVLQEAQEHQNKPDAVREKLLLRAADQQFFNASPLTLGTLSDTQTADDLMSYVQAFSQDAREIFEHFEFEGFVQQLSANNLLYQVVQRFASIDLSPRQLSNFGMGLVFEELIRKFAESSNDTAGEHFTLRDVVHLTTSLVLTGQDDKLKPHAIVTIYDPTAGTGGFLSEGDEYIQQVSQEVTVSLHGQELNPESYAICKADMLIKGQAVESSRSSWATRCPTTTWPASASTSCSPIRRSGWSGRKSRSRSPSWACPPTCSTTPASPPTSGCCRTTSQKSAAAKCS